MKNLLAEVKKKIEFQEKQDHESNILAAHHYGILTGLKTAKRMIKERIEQDAAKSARYALTGE